MTLDDFIEKKLNEYAASKDTDGGYSFLRSALRECAERTFEMAWWNSSTTLGAYLEQRTAWLGTPDTNEYTNDHEELLRHNDQPHEIPSL